MYCHTEQRRTQRFYIVVIVRHRGTVGAWRNRGYLRVLLIFSSTSLQKQWFTRFLKTFIRLLPKLSATRTLRLCRSLCLRHLREVVCFHLRVLPLSVWLLYVLDLLYHSIFRKNLFYISILAYHPIIWMSFVFFIMFMNFWLCCHSSHSILFWNPLVYSCFMLFVKSDSKLNQNSSC